MDNLKSVIETLIFVSETPLAEAKIKEVLQDIHEGEISSAIHALVQEYEQRNGGIFLRKIAGGYQFRTSEDTALWVQKLRGQKPAVLSAAAMETLAVIAYRQPVMKADIEKVRGVDVSGSLRGLLEKNLVRIMGRKNVPGRPIIYGTTRIFLETFGLNSLSDLPTLSEFKELEE
ncbi:MAG TPA: SMC-Scp complex subunit ScpB [Syntrophales bacterium]|nr:SMC-Scp complex subunit ScpB [Syntrophales bacterium]HPQ45187.1 SMC-Scp complex subunit ScpB [Syntrophales bacterium]